MAVMHRERGGAMSVQVVRTRLRAVILIMVLLATGFIGCVAVGGVAIMIKAPSGTGLPLLGLALLAGSLVLGYLMSRTNHWVEIEGETIRERRLFTGSIFERTLAEITQIVPLVSGVGGFTGAAMDAILRTPNRGFLIRFQEGRRIALIRGDVKGLDSFMTTLRDRLEPSWTNGPV
jgi:hypothetical protein